MIDFTYNAVALIGVALIIYVMQKTEHDRINKIDPPSLQWFRRLAFIGSALSLCYSVVNADWQRSLPVLLLIAAADVILAVNAVALHLRTPPNPGSKLRHHAMRVDRSKLRPANFRDRHRE